MITQTTGKTEKAIIPNIFRQRHEALPNDELLYRYLIANTPLKAYDDGLPDEQQKVLKYFGVTYWEPGMEEVKFQGKNYKIVDSGQ
jgi:hypothetical protein